MLQSTEEKALRALIEDDEQAAFVALDGLYIAELMTLQTVSRRLAVLAGQQLKIRTAQTGATTIKENS